MRTIEQKRADQRERSIQRRIEGGVTPEQAEADQVRADERSVKFMCVVRAAKDDATEKGYIKGHGGKSSLPCPACKDGTLRYSVAGSNGHMIAACTTAGCVSWME